jgi:hypothetical protein
MAEVTCTECGTTGDDVDGVCPNCWRPHGAKPRPAQDQVYGVPSVAPLADSADTPEPTDTAEVDCRVCGGGNGPTVEVCVHCNVAVPNGPMRARIEVLGVRPTTLRRHEGDRVELGRGSNHPPDMVAALNPYDDVSRDHATVRLLRRRVEVTDRSSNGTWVEGERLATGHPRGFALPVDLDLAHECRVTITVDK